MNSNRHAHDKSRRHCLLRIALSDCRIWGASIIYTTDVLYCIVRPDAICATRDNCNIAFRQQILQLPVFTQFLGNLKLPAIIDASDHYSCISFTILSNQGTQMCKSMTKYREKKIYKMRQRILNTIFIASPYLLVSHDHSDQRASEYREKKNPLMLVPLSLPHMYNMKPPNI